VVVRQDQWKGIWHDELGTLELYDLETDPGERLNVRAEHPELGEVLGDRAQAWLKDCWAQAKQPAELGEIDAETQERLRALGYFN
jgi:arylsulfatase A-like enzyme